MNPFFKNSALKICLVLTAGFACQSYGVELCVNLLQKTKLIVEALDAEYGRIATQISGKKQTAMITDLLNRAFFPMMDQLSIAVKNMDENFISSKLSEVRKEQPIQRGTYMAKGHNRVAIVKDPTILRHLQVNTGSTVRYQLFDHPQVKKFDSMMYVTPSQSRLKKFGGFHLILGTAITPVGGYGENFAIKMLRTSEVLSRLAEQNLETLSSETYKLNSLLLQSESARAGYAPFEQAIPHQTPLSALIEGIQSFHQLVNIMLAEKIPGVATGEEALKKFVFSPIGRVGLTSSLTSRIPMALVGPMTNSGLGFKNTLKLNANGHLELTEEIKSTLNDLMDIQVEGGRRRSRCPMASFFAGKIDPNTPSPHGEHDKAGLQILAETYWKVFEVVSKQENYRSAQRNRINTIRSEKGLTP